MRIEQSLQTGLDKTASPKNAAKGGGDFGTVLMDALKDLNESQQNATKLQNQFMAGQSGVEVHDVMIAMEKASMAMQLTMQVRNKVLDAYQELSRMQV